MALKKASSKYPGIFINEYKNGNVAYYINYRNEEGTPTLKKVGMKTKQSNYTIMDAYDRLIEVKHKIATGEELPKVVQRKAKVLFEDIFEDYLNWAKANKKTISVNGTNRYVIRTDNPAPIRNDASVRKLHFMPFDF